MKILITTDWPEQAVNGVATSIKNLKAGLLQAGHEVKILTLSGDVHSRKEGDTYYIGSMNAGAIYPNARLKLLMPHEWVKELFRFLKKCSPDQRLLVVGGGPDQPRLEQLAQELGIREQLIFTGLIPPQQIANYYRSGDIFVSASTSETQGLTYMEAMASALPLLCRADECLDGVIQDGVNGLVYRNEQEFLERLRQLKEDFAFRNQLGILARQSVEKRYSIPAFAAACLNVYRSLENTVR